MNTKIIAESFFTNFPKDTILLERDFVPLDKSIIWKLNELFWKHYDVWEKVYNEHYESSLPLGISESHRPEFIQESAQRFLMLLQKLQDKKELPEKIYVYEQGPGTGIFAKGFLDYIQEKDFHIYNKTVYILSDTSEEILKNCAIFLSPHKQHVKFYMQDAFEQQLEKFAGKVLFARHSNVWDGWPGRALQLKAKRLAETYVRAVCSEEFTPFVKKIQERGLEYTLLKHSKEWKDFFQSIKFQRRKVFFNKKDIKENEYALLLAEENDLGSTLMSESILDNLQFLQSLIDWERNGYIEIVDIISRQPLKNVWPLKFDGAVGYTIDGRIIEFWCRKNGKNCTFTPIRRANTLLTIHDTNKKDMNDFVKEATLELYPEDLLEQKISKLPHGSHLAITCTSKKGIGYTIQTTERLIQAGFNAYPHIVARLVEDKEHLEAINKELMVKKIHEVFVAGGDIATPTGVYDSAMSLLNDWEKVGFPCKKVAITGYPEGHPNIPEEKLEDALEQKQEFAKKHDLEMRVITQLCFDADTIVKWACAIKEHGISLPITIGIPGPCNVLKLIQFASKCGVGDSVKFLASKSILGRNIATHLAFQYKPDQLVKQISNHPKLSYTNIVGLHVYTFNNIDGYIKWGKNFLRNKTGGVTLQ